MSLPSYCRPRIRSRGGDTTCNNVLSTDGIRMGQALTLAGALGDDVEGNDSRGLREGRLGRRTLLELGCGVGNAVFPILAENRGLYVVAVDLSPRAIGILKQHPLYR